jgi:hypothetical protein
MLRSQYEYVVGRLKPAKQTPRAEIHPALIEPLDPDDLAGGQQSSRASPLLSAADFETSPVTDRANQPSPIYADAGKES